MRGGMQLHDAYQSTYDERKAIGEMVDENLKTTKESKMPFF